MKTETFEASSIREAMLQVRESLGPEAVILGTREIRRAQPNAPLRFAVTAARLPQLQPSAEAHPEAAAAPAGPPPLPVSHRTRPAPEAAAPWPPENAAPTAPRSPDVPPPVSAAPAPAGLAAAAPTRAARAPPPPRRPAPPRPPAASTPR
ncbi:MAG: hypothetical protein H6744_14155 [Deltaproteobacteria bacterium]|nr:hypothetical protein [Deltaproteobacteria bacterium]